MGVLAFCSTVTFSFSEEVAQRSLHRRRRISMTELANVAVRTVATLKIRARLLVFRHASWHKRDLRDFGRVKEMCV